MGWIEVLTAVASGSVCGFIAGSIAGYYAGWAYKIEQDQLKKRVDSLWGTQNTQKGVAAREAITLEKVEMAGKIAAVLKEEGKPDEKLAKVFGVAAEHPEVSLKFIEKMGRTI